MTGGKAPPSSWKDVVRPLAGFLLAAAAALLLLSVLSGYLPVILRSVGLSAG